MAALRAEMAARFERLERQRGRKMRRRDGLLLAGAFDRIGQRLFGTKEVLRFAHEHDAELLAHLRAHDVASPGALGCRLRSILRGGGEVDGYRVVNCGRDGDGTLWAIEALE